jgi:hypothetical protein
MLTATLFFYQNCGESFKGGTDLLSSGSKSDDENPPGVPTIADWDDQIAEAALSFLPDDEVIMPAPPLWVKDAVFYNMRIDRFSPPKLDGSEPGTFESALTRMDHLVESGVTTLILKPIMQQGRLQIYDNTINFYGVSEPTKVDDFLSETGNGNESFAKFVRVAHSRGLKVVLDVIPMISTRALGPNECMTLTLARKSPLSTGSMPWSPLLKLSTLTASAAI